MTAASGPYSLLAMPRSGEAVLVRDPEQRIWLIRTVLRYAPELVGPDDVNIAVVRYDWERIDRDFASWADLEDYRLQRAREGVDHLTQRDISDFGRREAEVRLQQIDRQIGKLDSEHRAAAVDLLIDLLTRCPALRLNSDLFDRASVLLNTLRRDSYREQPTRPPDEMAEAVRRMDIDHIAA